MGPRRIAAALGEILRRYRPFAARRLALEDVNVYLAPFLSHLDEDALAEEVRELLRSPEWAAFPARGGLLELEIGLAAEVPVRLVGRAVPPPARPGRAYGDFADTAREVGRMLLREAAALRRRGWSRGPRFTLVLPARGAARRGGPGPRARGPGHGGRGGGAGGRLRGDRAPRPAEAGWLRLRETEAPDPLRFRRGRRLGRHGDRAQPRGRRPARRARRHGASSSPRSSGSSGAPSTAPWRGAPSWNAAARSPGAPCTPSAAAPCRSSTSTAPATSSSPWGWSAPRAAPGAGLRGRLAGRASAAGSCGTCRTAPRVEASARGLQAAVRESLADEAGARFAALRRRPLRRGQRVVGRRGRAAPTPSPRRRPASGAASRPSWTA